MCLRTYGGPKGVGVSYDRGTPVANGSSAHSQGKGMWSHLCGATWSEFPTLLAQVQGYLAHKEMPTPLGPL